MNDLQIDWEQDRPNAMQLYGLWKSLQISPVSTWTDATEILAEKISETHINGGGQFHKYVISRNRYFDWFASRNRLEEIDFIQNVFRHQGLKEYRRDIGVPGDKLEVEVIANNYDIFDLPGQLARILHFGGAYNRTKVGQKEAWSIVLTFIENEFENRFSEFELFQLSLKNAAWFYNIAWDNSIAIFDKRKYELIIIDITDSD